MKRFILYSILFGATVFAAAPVHVHTGEVLFLAHYNHSVSPDIGNSQGMIDSGAITGGKSGYPFKNSSPQAEALNANGRDKYMAYPGEKNFDKNKGTLQMFVKGKWKQNAYAHCVFFKLFDNAQLKGCFVGPNSFMLQKSPKVQQIKLFQNGNLRVNGISTQDLPYNDELWRHLTVTWDMAAKYFKLYLDGEFVGEWKRMQKMTADPMFFTIGHPDSHNAQSLIDEVRILNRPLTDAEVKQDYLYLKEGNEFPAPSIQRKDVDFNPIPVKQEPSGLEATLEPVEFNVAGMEKDFELDGKLSNPAWKTAAPTPPLLARNGKNPEQNTEIKLLYSNTALYISAVFQEPDMKNLVAQFDQNDLSLWNDDCFEMVLDITGRPNEHYHIIVNPLGYIYDARGGKKSWNGSGFLAKTALAEDSWTMELKLPFSAFGISRPEPGEFWAARFCRERHHEGGGTCAVPQCKTGGLGTRSFMGKLAFKPISGTDSSLSSEVKTFTMGMNTIPINLDGKPGSCKLRARLFDDQNKILGENATSFNIPGNVLFQVPVKNDRTQRMVISLLDENGKTADSIVLRPHFQWVSPGIVYTDIELANIEKTCNDLLSINHPVYRGAAKSIQRVRKAITEYSQKVDDAVKNGKPVPAESTNEICELLNGFKDFREKYRCLIWQTSPWETGSPNALPPMDYDNDLKLTFTQAGNEREHITLLFSGALSGRTMELRIFPEPISKKNAPYIGSDRFEIYQEHFINYNGQWITGPLLKNVGDVITVTPGNATRVRIVFNSRGVPPGEYETSLTVKSLYDFSIPNRSIPVKMKIWNFTLPETRDWPIDSFFWGPNRRDNDEAQVLKIMHKRHINWGWTESVRYIQGFSTVNGAARLPKGQLFNEELVKTANQEFFDTAKLLGMKFIFGWGTVKSVKWHQLMDERLLKMGFTRDDFVFKAHLRDEFLKKHIHIPGDVEFRKEIMAANPGWQLQAVYLSVPPPQGATLQDIDDAKLTDLYKVWTVISGNFTNPERCHEVTKFFRDRNCKIWAYTCSTGMYGHPLLEYYRCFPWLAYQKKLDGVAMWTTISTKSDGFDPRDGFDDGALMLGTDRTSAPTKNLEAFSEGLEDVAYMFELEKHLKRLDGKIPEPEMAKYKALITSSIENMRNNPIQQKLDTWRSNMGETIDALSKK